MLFPKPQTLSRRHLMGVNMTQEKRAFKSLNQVTACGRLGKNPELRFTKNGKPMTKVSIALSRGDENETTDWVNVLIWGKQAERIASTAQKGSELIVFGSIQTSSWEKDGKTNYSTDIVADRVLLSQKMENQSFSKHNDAPIDDLPF